MNISERYISQYSRFKARIQKPNINFHVFYYV